MIRRVRALCCVLAVALGVTLAMTLAMTLAVALALVQQASADEASVASDSAANEAPSNNAFSHSGRLQLRAAAERVPQTDLRASDEGRQREGVASDLRLQFAFLDGAWRAEADLQLLADYGSALRGVQGAQIDGDPDGERGFDLAHALARAGAHRLRVRADRLLLGYRNESFAFSIGRQAVSWGNGIVFAPLDLLNPFAPNAVDRDFKAGDDLALAQWRMDDAADLQLIAVLRRSAGGARGSDEGSLGAHWRGSFGELETVLLVARHRRDDVVGVGLALPVADAVLRSDWVLTRLDDGSRAASFVVNADMSVSAWQRNVYLFAELYRNGFGSSDTPSSLAELSEALVQRRQRGELFTVGRWYTAIGATIEWHSLLRQSLLLIQNLNDGSALLQTNLRVEPDDRQRIDATLSWAGGDHGDEFAGLPIRAAFEGETSNDAYKLRRPATIGGGWSAELRLAWYW